MQKIGHLTKNFFDLTSHLGGFSTSIFIISFQTFFQNLSCQTRGVAYLQVQLYASVYGSSLLTFKQLCGGIPTVQPLAALD